MRCRSLTHLLLATGTRSVEESVGVQLAAQDVHDAVQPIVLRSDELRKELCGVAPLDRLGPEGYSPAVSEQVYATLADARQRGRGTSRIHASVITPNAPSLPITRRAGSGPAPEAGWRCVVIVPRGVSIVSEWQ